MFFFFILLQTVKRKQKRQTLQAKLLSFEHSCLKDMKLVWVENYDTKHNAYKIHFNLTHPFRPSAWLLYQQKNERIDGTYLNT